MSASFFESVGLQESRDSRSFGPLPLSNIVGRAIYGTRSPVDHGFVVNR